MVTMNDELKEILKTAIEKARNWATEGWKVTFGPREYEVNSLTDAEELAREFPYREDALGYWKNVKAISEEVISNLEKALAALEKGDLKRAENMAYAAQYFEKPLEKFTNTSRPVFERIQNG